jgi:hypothetical protein
MTRKSERAAKTERHANIVQTSSGPSASARRTKSPAVLHMTDAAATSAIP